MPEQVKAIAAIFIIVFGFELARIVRRVPKTIKALARGDIAWPGPRISESSQRAMMRALRGEKPACLIPSLIENSFAIIFAILIMLVYATDFFGVDTGLQRRSEITACIMFFLLLILALMYTSRALDNMLQLNRILSKIDVYRHATPSKSIRFHKAFIKLDQLHSDSCVAIRAAGILLPAFIFTNWYLGQRAWLPFTAWELLNNFEWARLVILAYYSTGFAILLFFGWHLGLQAMPVSPTATQAGTRLMLLWLLLSSVFPCMLRVLEVSSGSHETLRSWLVSSAVASLLVLIGGILGGLTWCSIKIAHNPAITALPKVLTIRFWLGAANFGVICCIGVLNDNIPGVVAFCSGILLAGTISRVLSFVVGIPAGLVIAFAVNRLELVSEIANLIGSGLQAGTAKLSALTTSAALGGACCARLIGLAEREDEG
jgi:hypothetical protein